MDWPKLIYGVFGPKFPVASQIAVTLVGALIFGGAWWTLGKHYRSSLQSTATQSAVSQNPALPSLAATNALAETLDISSPDDLRIGIKNGSDGKGTNGLILTFINDRPDPIELSKVKIVDAVSFDSRKSRFRTSRDYQPLQIGDYGTTPGGDIAKQRGFGHVSAWLVRIVGDHLELGANIGSGLLQWPAGDPNTKETWLLTFSVESKPFPVWTCRAHMEWIRGSAKILVSRET